ncbi:hypothetical protein JHK85_018343 [Glycine max]|nr:hypothetical protein JHK85_018343 [Glycine max]
MDIERDKQTQSTKQPQHMEINKNLKIEVPGEVDSMESRVDIAIGDCKETKTIFRNPKAIKPYAVPSPEHCNLPAAAMHTSSHMVEVVGLNAPAAQVAQHKWQPNTPDGQGTPFFFQHGKATSGSVGGNLTRTFKGPAGTGEEWQYPQALAFSVSGIRSQAIVSITCDKEIITATFYTARVFYTVCLSSDGVVMTWNESQRILSTFTLNGVLIAKTELTFSSSISCMEISVDGRSALIGINSQENGRAHNNSLNSQSSMSGIEAFYSESEETHHSNKIKMLHHHQVFHVLKLKEGQDITALALYKDNTNLLVSTWDKQLIIFTDPA